MSGRARVWAPFAERVELALGRERDRHPMVLAVDGWFEATPPLADGTDYGFVVDGRGPFPDPRSPSQPAGVHGLSRHVDPSRFRWTDANFRSVPLPGALIYELHVGTFTPDGTFEAAIARLDELLALGVTHVELMPVAAFPGRWGWGYDGVALYAPHAPYGGPEGLVHLVDACHARGLSVWLDVVYNHLGPSGNYLGVYGPYFTDSYRTPWGDAVNFSGRHSDEVRRFFIDNAVMWLRDYHFDGLRLDAVHAIFDASAVHFLEELTADVRALEGETGRVLTLVAESDLNDPRLVRPVARGGYGLDAQWSDDLHHALHAVLTGERTGYYADFRGLADVAQAIERGFVFEGQLSSFRGRRHGRPATDLASHALIGFLQNHDQTGNRAAGERVTALCSIERAMLGAALVMTSPSVPMLFQGEEWAATAPFLYFTDHEDPALAAAVRDGRRAEFAAFGWKPEDVPDPQVESTFRRSTLDWAERADGDHARMLAWYRALATLRRESPALRDANRSSTRVQYDDAAGWLVVARGTLVIACNFAHEVRLVPLSGEIAHVVLASRGPVDPKVSSVRLPAESVAIMERVVESGDRRV